MLLTTTDSIEGWRIVRRLGLVWACSVRSRHLGHDVWAFLKSLAGGEITSYKALLNEMRASVLRDIERNASKLGANAVIGIRFGSTPLMPTVVDIFAYGTAVVIKKA